MAKTLLDTSVIIDFLRRKDKEKSLLFNLVQDKNSLYASIITHSELYAGKGIWESNIAKKELESLFSGIILLDLNEQISQKAGQLKAQNGIDLIDAIIAATALIHDLNLATLNIKDFEKIKPLQITTSVL